MSTSAIVGRVVRADAGDTTYSSRRLNYDGDPETVLTVLGLFIKRDGWAEVAETLISHHEWRAFDPTALDPAPEGADYTTVVGYGQVYVVDEPILPEHTSEPSTEEPLLYYIDPANEVVLVTTTDGSFSWGLDDSIPHQE